MRSSLVLTHKTPEFIQGLQRGNIQLQIGKRNQGLANRRRIKAADLKGDELKWVKRHLKKKYSGTVFKASDYFLAKKAVCILSDWKLNLLASLIYMTCKDIVKSNDVILVDRDYSENVMKKINNFLSYLFKKGRKKIVVETGTSYNEVIFEADLIAGCIRKKLIKGRKISIKEIIELVKIL